MEMCAVSETMVQDLYKNGFGKENTHENFYGPLSATGYLTPLQRRKLREMRGFHSSISLESKKARKVIKSRVIKKKKEINACVSLKNNERLKKTKPKHHISEIHCSVARIISKTNDNLRENKFFKTSSPNRLEKANFSMPFVFKKSLFSKIDKNAKDIVLHSKKHTVFKDLGFNCQSFHNVNSNEDTTTTAAPCIIKVTNNISDVPKEWTESEKSVFDFDWPSDELLLKRQEEARTNIKKQQVLKEPVNSKDNLKEQQNIDEAVKYYPIFYVASRKQSKPPQDNKRKQKNGLKRIKKSLNGGEQMIIDAGQKEMGAKVCSTCSMIYSIGVEEDEQIHLNYHNTYLINLKFPGWKEENVIGEYSDGRIIMFRKNEHSFKIKKIEDVLEIANRDLGFSTSALPAKPDLTFLLFISNAKQVAGCVVAEPISHASRVLLAEDESSATLPTGQKEMTWRIGNWYSSSDTVPAVCGVNRIWVAHNYRRCKVASRMIDCLRCHFVHGHVIGIRELAFTDPSPDGREFAASYTGTDNFLVYR